MATESGKRTKEFDNFDYLIIIITSAAKLSTSLGQPLPAFLGDAF